MNDGCLQFHSRSIPQYLNASALKEISSPEPEEQITDAQIIQYEFSVPKIYSYL